MKNIILFTVLLFSMSGFAQTSTYPGNGKTGFGGPIGTGSLSITDNGTSLTFTLTKGSNPLNDIVVFYVDFTTGGLSSTTSLTGTANQYERAVSGKNTTPGEVSTLTFPTGFTPDMAIAFDKDGGRTYFFPPTGSTPTNMIASKNRRL
jgi:hypothetical protein